MRILLATESYRSSSGKPFSSGVAVFVDRLANYLAQNNHKVLIITPSPEFFEKSVLEKKTSDNLSVEYLPSWPNPFRSNSRIVAPLGLTAIKGVVIKFRPDIIHLQDPAEIGVTVLHAAKKLKIPVVITSHSYLEFASSYLRFLGPLDKFVEKMVLDHIVRVYNDCDAVTAPTSVLGKTIKKWGVLPKIYTVSSGVELDKFCPGSVDSGVLEKYGISENKRVILYVGRLDKDKSLETVLKAAPLILTERRDSHFLFVGDGSSKEEYMELGKSLGLSKNISWAGYVSHDSKDLPEIYRSADVFVMPSIESYGIAALEAMASGVPVVAANAGGLKEIMKNGSSGRLFKFGNHKSLSKAVVAVLEDKEKASQYRKKGIAAASEHDLPNSLKRMVKVYEAVLR